MDIYAYVHMTVLAYAGAAVQKGEGAVDDREFAKILIRGEGVTTEFKPRPMSSRPSAPLPIMRVGAFSLALRTTERFRG